MCAAWPVCVNAHTHIVCMCVCVYVCVVLSCSCHRAGGESAGPGFGALVQTHAGEAGCRATRARASRFTHTYTPMSTAGELDRHMMSTTMAAYGAAPKETVFEKKRKVPPMLRPPCFAPRCVTHPPPCFSVVPAASYHLPPRYVSYYRREPSSQRAAVLQFQRACEALAPLARCSRMVRRSNATM